MSGLTLWAAPAESLWDESLPVVVKELPADLAALDRVLGDPELMMVLFQRWRLELVETGRTVLTDGRPTIAMQTYVRLMVLKARYRWGYRVLVAEVSDSIHLRRFCRISLGDRVPDESIVRKLAVLVTERKARVRDRSRAMGRKLRALSRPPTLLASGRR